MDAITLDAARTALSYIPSDEASTWIRMGFALVDEFGEAGRDVWMDWSSRAANFNESDARTRWKSLARQTSVGGGKPITIATLIYEAKRCGWKADPSSDYVKMTADEERRRAAERQAARAERQRAEEEDYAAAAVRADAIWAAAGPALDAHPYLVRKGVKAHGLRHTPVWSLEVIDASTGEIRQITVANALLVPKWARPGVLASLQAIFPSRRNALKKDKVYLQGGRSRGSYHVIGAIGPDTLHVVICEGYATGATIHEATGWPVMVAFDAGNLAAVAAMVRARMPKAVLVLAADNDQYPRDDGAVRNTGVDAATAAAKECGGILAVPQFSDLKDRPTDFNDLAAAAGIEIVRAQIDLAINPPPPPAEQPPEPDADGTIPPPPPAPESMHVLGYDPSEYFRVLGYDHERYFFMSHESRQVVECTKGDFSDVGLLELAPLNWWEENFAGEKGMNKKMAANWLIRACRDVGIYDNSRMRGRGAWIDDGRIVFHHGEKMSVDGHYMPFDGFRSRYVYEMDRPLPEPADEMLTADEGEWLLDLAAMFRWTKEGSAALLAGWVALAPVCGALRWRPHIWCHGGAGSGKSTVLNEYVHQLLGGVDLFAQGSSSEAGIRQRLKADARPVLFDESESNEENDARRIQNVLSLIRQASTESQAVTLKGTAGGDAMEFHIRSMFCLASIQTAIKNQADIERLAVLSLRPKREEKNAAETWEKMQERLHQLKRDKTYSARLFRRALNLLPVTLKSISVFSNAFAQRCGSVRDGDQYGTLLAGTWSLISDRVPTQEEAFELIDRYDWSEHREAHDVDDSERALGYLLESRVRVPGGVEVTVYELIREAAGKGDGSVQIGAAHADAMLQRFGMRLTEDNRHVLLSNNSRTLKDLLADTPFAADIRGMLLRLVGVTRYSATVRFNGLSSRCIAIPLRHVLGSDDAPARVE